MATSANDITVWSNWERTTPSKTMAQEITFVGSAFVLILLPVHLLHGVCQPGSNI
jgi:hypothetical protein